MAPYCFEIFMDSLLSHLFSLYHVCLVCLKKIIQDLPIVLPYFFWSEVSCRGFCFVLKTKRNSKQAAILFFVFYELTAKSSHSLDFWRVFKVLSFLSWKVLQSEHCFVCFQPSKKNLGTVQATICRQVKFWRPARLGSCNSCSCQK